MDVLIISIVRFDGPRKIAAIRHDAETNPQTHTVALFAPYRIAFQ